MRYSELFGRTTREVARDEESLNAKLLSRAGFVHKLMAGVYSFLPLGWRTLAKIENIIREEMSSVGGQEVFMPALQPKENWEQTGRWSSLDVLYRLKSREAKELALGPTHEEVIVPLAKLYIQSYKDLPLYVYQIQTKFRDELRAKSGLLRGREFRMKDLYSFHANEKDLLEYYEKVKEAYLKIFYRTGLKALVTEASGGTFSKYSHEFQVPTTTGEDIVYHCAKCGFTRNREIIAENLAKLNPGEKGICPQCQGDLAVLRTSEVGNIFQLKTKFSDPFNLTYVDKDGSAKPVLMGCYGIGTSRLMGTIAEIYNDDKGLKWPEQVAPFKVHLVTLGETRDFAETVYIRIGKADIDIMYDERDESSGVKLFDADLIGIPYRIVVSDKTARENKIELKKRDNDRIEVMTVDQALSILNPKSEYRNPKQIQNPNI